MLLPSVFRSSFVNSFFDDVFDYPSKVKTYTRLMNTDVKELDNEYQVDIELAGFDKEDIKLELKDGSLTVRAGKRTEKEEKKEKGKYIRKERYSGTCSRTFYLGDHVEEEDIHASFKNGLLRIVFPKDKEVEVVEEKRYIPIDEL